MAKKGMKRPDDTHTQPRNEQAAVPELQGKQKSGKEKAKPIDTDSEAPSLRVFHEKLLASSQIEKPVTDVYDVFDNDLARDNMENDLTEPEIDAMKNLWP